MSNELHDLQDLPARPRIEISDTDRKLLRQAANALGAVHVEEVDGEGYVSLHFADGLITRGWNPLLFSADAFNMMVDADLAVHQSVLKFQTLVTGIYVNTVVEQWGLDKAAATRRAITRAVAQTSPSEKS